MTETELPIPETPTEAWNELVRQSLLTHSLGQVECGRTTHNAADFTSCGYCGAAL